MPRLQGGNTHLGRWRRIHPPRHGPDSCRFLSPPAFHLDPMAAAHPGLKLQPLSNPVEKGRRSRSSDDLVPGTPSGDNQTEV